MAEQDEAENRPTPSALPDAYDPLAQDTAAMQAVDPLRSTRELPPVREPFIKPFAVDSSLTGMFEPSPLPGEPQRTSSVPVSPVFAAHGATDTTQAPPDEAPEKATPAASSGVRPSLVVGGLVLVLLVALAAWLLPRSGGDATATPTTTPTTTAPVQVSLSSMDPVGGSGFAQKGKAWVTQTYRTADFGNLKPGVGLVLDLESAQQVGQVSFSADGITAQLRSADAPSDDPDDWTPVGSATTTGGATTLDAETGGAHRYWLIWVTELAPADGGFSARITDVQVTR